MGPQGGAPVDVSAETDLEALQVDVDATSQAYLVARLGANVRIVEVPIDGVMTVGRAIESTFAVEDGRVSRNHARFIRTPQGLFVEDLGSRNGTRVAQKILRSEGCNLHGGETVGIGPLEIVVAISVPAQQASSPPSVELPLERVIVADASMVKLSRLVR